jgi:VID27 C-terminal WD40-like domain
MLHDQDRTLIMMNPQNEHSLYQMDLETGKVVEEWKVHDDIAINSMAPVDKLAQMTSEQTIYGTSHNAIFRVDPRVTGSKLVQRDMKQYVTKNKFSSIATTEKGHIAVASEKGDIRLFDALGKNAKTSLPALGDSIRGLDVTKDGRWVIATCKTYLLLIDTQIGSGKNVGGSGFTKSFPVDAKPKPKRLQLRPEHVSFMGSQINFSPAK